MSDMNSGLSWAPEWLKCSATVIKLMFSVGLNSPELRVCQNTVQEWNCMRILSVCEKTKQAFVTSFSSKNRVFFSECAFVPLPDVADTYKWDTDEFTAD